MVLTQWHLVYNQNVTKIVGDIKVAVKLRVTVKSGSELRGDRHSRVGFILTQFLLVLAPNS